MRLQKQEYLKRIRSLEADLAEAVKAVEAMVRATDEWAAEFTQHMRAMNWGVVNEAYMLAGKVLRKKRGA